MLLINFGFYYFWNEPMKVTFDGPNKLILINEDELIIDVKEDIFSAWKLWILDTEHGNFGWEQALSAVGGDPLPGGQFVGTTFFLENGWKIRPFAKDHILTINGNLFSRDGSNPFIPAVSDATITVNLSTSNLIDLVSTPLSDLQIKQLQELWQLSGLDSDFDLVVTATSRDVGGTVITQTIAGTETVTVSRTN